MQHRWRSHHAFLVRCWEEGAPGNWRASAQHAQSGEIVRFATTAQLFAFLQAAMPTPCAAEPDPPVEEWSPPV